MGSIYTNMSRKDEIRNSSSARKEISQMQDPGSALPQLYQLKEDSLEKEQDQTMEWI